MLFLIIPVLGWYASRKALDAALQRYGKNPRPQTQIQKNSHASRELVRHSSPLPAEFVNMSFGYD